MKNVTLFLKFLSAILNNDTLIKDKEWLCYHELFDYMKGMDIPGLEIKKSYATYTEDWIGGHRAMIQIRDSGIFVARLSRGPELLTMIEVFKNGDLRRQWTVDNSEYTIGDKDQYGWQRFLTLMARYNSCPICGALNASPDPGVNDGCTHPSYRTISEIEAVMNLVLISKHIETVSIVPGSMLGESVAFLRVRNKYSYRYLTGSKNRVIPDPVAVIAHGTLTGSWIQQAINDIAKDVTHRAKVDNKGTLDDIGDRLAELFMYH